MEIKTNTFKIVVVAVIFLFFSNSQLFVQAGVEEIKSKNLISENTLREKQGDVNNYIQGEVLVKYKKSKINLKNSKGAKKATGIGQRLNLARKKEFKNMNTQLLRSEEKSTQEIITELKNNSDVEYAEPNYRRYPLAVPDDTYFGQQYGLQNTGQSVNGSAGTADADIDAPEAWDGELIGNQDVKVAVIDTGVKYSHPDLLANMWNGSAGCKDSNNNDIIGSCPSHGWNLENGNNNPDDTNGHGTAVAGVIGGVSNNGAGISGTSYQNKLKIMAVRFDFTVAQEIEAINFARFNGAKVINASYGGPDFSQLEKDAIDSFPGIFVAAAGNDGVNNEATHNYPSDYSSANIVAVASTGKSDGLSSFSNYGVASVDVGASGEDIMTAHIGGGYGYIDGTSFAAPIVSGIAGMIYSKNPAYSIAQVKARIIDSGDALVALSGKVVSGKRVNLNSALAADGGAPILAEVSGIAAQISATTPAYIFSSTESGTISYAGDCASPTITAVSGSNTITFNALAEGAHSNCSIIVTDAFGNASSPLNIASFSIVIPPVLAQVSAVASLTADTTPDFSFSSTESGTISYVGDCASSTTAATAGNNTITFNALAEGAHSNCSITVTDAFGNASSFLNVGTFTVNTNISISSYSVSNITKTSATINWTTDIPSSGSAQYGMKIKKRKNKKTKVKTTSIVKGKNADGGAIGTSHSATVKLMRNKKYYYKITVTNEDRTHSAATGILAFKTKKK